MKNLLIICGFLIASSQASSQGIDVNRALDRAYDAISDNFDQSSDRLVESVNRSRSSNQSQQTTTGSRLTSNLASFLQIVQTALSGTSITKAQWDQTQVAADKVGRNFGRKWAIYESSIGAPFSGEISNIVDSTVNLTTLEEQVYFGAAALQLMTRLWGFSKTRFGAALGKERFVTVEAVEPNSPMDRAGIETGDQIIAFAVGNEALISTRRMEQPEFLAHFINPLSKVMKFQVLSGDQTDTNLARTVRIMPERKDLESGRWLEIDDPQSSTISNETSQDERTGNEIVDGLNNLNGLHQQGVLSEEEFNAAKRRLLGL